MVDCFNGLSVVRSTGAKGCFALILAEKHPEPSGSANGIVL